MQTKKRQAYIEEIKYQTKMLNNLKKWLRYLISVSSVCLALAVFGNNLFNNAQLIGTVFAAVSVIGCLFVGLALKRGHDNVNKIIAYLDKKQRCPKI